MKKKPDQYLKKLNSYLIVFKQANESIYLNDMCSIFIYITWPKVSLYVYVVIVFYVLLIFASTT